MTAISECSTHTVARGPFKHQIELEATIAGSKATEVLIDPEEAAKWVADYERLIEEECVPIGRAVNPRIACVTPMMCHHDPETALRMGIVTRIHPAEGWMRHFVAAGLCLLLSGLVRLAEFFVARGTGGIN